MFGGWCWLLVETMWVTGPHIFSRLAQAYSYDRVLRVPRSIKRKQAQCKSSSHISALIMLSNTPLVKASHMVKPRFKGCRNRFHILMGIAAKSHCKGVCMQRVHFCKQFTIPLLPVRIAAHARTLSCIWLAVLQAWLDFMFHVFPVVK